MPHNDYEENVDGYGGSDDLGANDSINPKDSYLDRFSVTSRKPVSSYRSSRGASRSKVAYPGRRNSQFSDSEFGGAGRSLSRRSAARRGASPRTTVSAQSSDTQNVQTGYIQPSESRSILDEAPAGGSTTSAIPSATPSAAENQPAKTAYIPRAHGASRASDTQGASVAAAAAKTAEVSRAAVSDVSSGTTHTAASAQQPASSEPVEVVEKLRSSGLDSLFSSTVVPAPEPVAMVEEASVEAVSVPDTDKIAVVTSETFSAVKEEIPSYRSALNSVPSVASRQRENNSRVEVSSEDDLDSTAGRPTISQAASWKTNTELAAREQKQRSQSERKLQVMKPTSYTCVELISSSLLAGNVVVICLTNTDPSLAVRVLDFAFGAASMCGAQVSLEGRKTYVIAIGEPLTDREKFILVKQGIVLSSN